MKYLIDSLKPYLNIELFKQEEKLKKQKQNSLKSSSFEEEIAKQIHISNTNSEKKQISDIEKQIAKELNG